MRSLLAIAAGLLITVSLCSQVMLPHRKPIYHYLVDGACDCSPESIPDNYLLARWSFDEGSGYFTDDLSGNGNFLMLSRGAVWSDELFSHGVRLDGPAYLRTTGPLNFNTNLITITATLKWDAFLTNDAVLYGLGDNPFTGGRGAFDCDPNTITGTVAVNIENGDSSLNGCRFNFHPWVSNTWTTVSLIYDNSTTNGNVQAVYCADAGVLFTNYFTKDYAGNFATNLLFIGAYGLTNPPTVQFGPSAFNVADIRIYGGSLTTNEMCYVSRHVSESGTPSSWSSLTNGLVSYWPLEEGLNQTRFDYWGTNNLTSSNNVALAQCRVQNGARFDNTGRLLIAQDSPELSAGSTNFTITGWFSIASSVPCNFLQKRNPSFWEYGLLYSSVATRFQFFINGASTKSVSADALGVPSTGTHYFIAAWMDTGADTICIQVNAGSTNSTALAGVRPSDTTAPLLFGANGLGNYCDGTVDEVMFHKRVLNASERADLYNAGRGRGLR